MSCAGARAVKRGVVRLAAADRVAPEQALTGDQHSDESVIVVWLHRHALDVERRDVTERNRLPLRDGH